MAQHRTPDTGQMSWKYFSHIYTQPGQGHLGLVLGNRVNPKGLWEAGPAVGAGEAALDPSGRMCAACMISSASWPGGKTTGLRTRWAAAGLADRVPHPTGFGECYLTRARSSQLQV